MTPCICVSKGSGGFVFRLANLQADRVFALLSNVPAQAATELKRGAVVLVEESRFRIRHLPLGS